MKLYGKWNQWRKRVKMTDKSIKKKKWTSKNLLQQVTIFFILLIAITLVLSINFFPDKILLKEGQIGSKDILSSRDFEFVDFEATQNLKEKASKSIKEVYDLNLANIENVEKQVDALFLKIGEYKEKREESLQDNNVNIVEMDKKLTDDELNKKAKEINENLRLYISEQVIENCLQLDNLSLEKIKVDIKSSMRKIMEQGIIKDDLENAKKQLIREISEISIDHYDALIASEIATSLLLPSLFLNEEDTEKRRQEAISSVTDIVKTIQKGQIIIRKGEIVTSEDITILNVLGLKNPKINFSNIIGIIMITALCLLVFFFYLNYFYPNIYNNINKLILLSIISIFIVLLAKIAGQASGYLIPMASASMLIAISFNPNIAILLTVLLSLLIGFIPGGALNYILVSVISGIIAICSIQKAIQRSSLTRAGLLIAGVNIIAISALGLINNEDYYLILQENLWGVLNGFLAFILTIGILPFLESYFDITTSFKLMELSNPNQPLLKKMIVEAPGTYHHSIVVGNLSETAAEEIGGNALLARVGAIYHDIGKIKRPYFFTENQEAYRNIHDDMEPSLSALVIASHVKEGIELAKKNKLPKDIIDIITQHHGTGLITYFFHRAVKENGSAVDAVAEENYRYSGPKPQTKEAGIILLADSLEAATRSLTNPTATRIKTLVKEIIQKNLESGQLEECDLTLKDLDKIGDSFARILTGMFHTRVEYPDDDLIRKVKEEKKKNGNSNRKSTKNNKDKSTKDKGHSKKGSAVSES
ncbi:MAG: HDIG domain-containing protein [Candidatus Atribacteria bacterium]|nr:MAG: HDIG domain-containing protein [Candidatus Atribacteria bacterium]